MLFAKLYDYMAIKYSKDSKLLTDSSFGFAKWNDVLQSSFMFSLTGRNFKHKNSENASFIKAGCSVINGWAKSANFSNYKYNKANLPFAIKLSCPIPQVYTSGECAIAVDTAVVREDGEEMWIRYNSSVGYCQYKTTTSGSWAAITPTSTGVFVILQGGGGGGGEGYSFNRGVANDCIGGGGGGGGAFVAVYLDLSAIPNQGVYIKSGWGGSQGGAAGDHVQIDNGAKGSSGGDSYISYNGAIIASAGGGTGGNGGNINFSYASGGTGGSASWSSAYEWLTILETRAGANGGKSGEASGYAFGIPYGTKNGANGGNMSATDTMSFGILNSSNSMVVWRDDWKSGYVYGSGGYHTTWGTDGYVSGGGGGGGSVMSCRKKTNDQAGSTSRGYGMGGYGGPAEGKTVHGANSGSGGYAAVLKCILP